MGASTVEFWGYRNPLGVPRPHLNRTIKCMANPRRVAMVAKQIMRELSDMLLTDTHLQSAILPEAALGADRFLSSVTTISDVELSADLQVMFLHFFSFAGNLVLFYGILLEFVVKCCGIRQLGFFFLVNQLLMRPTLHLMGTASFCDHTPTISSTPLPRSDRGVLVWFVCC